MRDVTPEEAQRLAAKLDAELTYIDAGITPQYLETTVDLHRMSRDTIRTLADEVERLEAELAETKEGWRLSIEQNRVNVMPETESAVHIAELETEIARLRSGVDRLEAARFAIQILRLVKS